MCAIPQSSYFRRYFNVNCQQFRYSVWYGGLRYVPIVSGSRERRGTPVNLADKSYTFSGFILVHEDS